MKNIFCTLVLIAAFHTLGGCADDSVYMSNQNAVQIGFYSHFSAKNLHVLKDTTIKKISAYAVGKPKIYDTASVSTIFLPLRFDSDTTKFILKSDLNSSIITFIHSKEQIYINGTNGFTYNLLLKEVQVESDIIDSVVITAPGINYNENYQNVKVFFN